ncbi:hypothetical protein [Limnohabitans sp. DM1]|uniref:hypothetical protein n=1 Tax=Limnohabitans sp. DM1 TaxID=1597955 RepID=UPI000B13733F|nr:hypothetical protein [Limnohabitans sp. DM1]
MNRRRLILAVSTVLVAAVVLLIALKIWPTIFERKKTMTSSPVSLQLGMLADDFDRALGLEQRIDRQPAGLNFHKRRWPARLPGTVRLLHGGYSFDMDAVLSVMGTEDVERTAFGIERLSIGRGVTADDVIPHDEARLKTMAFIRQLLQIGWRPYYHRSEARLNGKSSWADSDDRDPRYTPSFDEWMRDNDHHWKFEVDGVYLRLSVSRSYETPDPLKPGAYLMSLDLETELHKVRLWFPEEKRNNWKEHWAELMQYAVGQRAKEEAKARAQGLEIDTAYQDPRILAVEGPVITARVGEPCPKSGLWEASLPAVHPSAPHLAGTPSRWRQLQAGEPMPGFGQSLLPDAQAINAAIVWTWHKAP